MSSFIVCCWLFATKATILPAGSTNGECVVYKVEKLAHNHRNEVKLNPIKVIRAWLLPKLNSVHHALCLAGSDALGIRHCRKQRWSKLSFFKYFFLIGNVNAAGQKSILHAATYKSDKPKEPWCQSHTWRLLVVDVALLLLGWMQQTSNEKILVRKRRWDF